MNTVTDVQVAKIIGSFNDSAAGWDDMRPKIIKGIKAYIKLPLTRICNLSFTSGVFPTELKLANVVPIYKANDEMVFFQLPSCICSSSSLETTGEIDVQSAYLLC